jgi:hypothetical protein
MQRHRRILLTVCELIRGSTSLQAQICDSHLRKSPDRRDKTQDRTIFQDFRRLDPVFSPELIFGADGTMVDVNKGCAGVVGEGYAEVIEPIRNNLPFGTSRVWFFSSWPAGLYSLRGELMRLLPSTVFRAFWVRSVKRFDIDGWDCLKRRGFLRRERIDEIS